MKNITRMLCFLIMVLTVALSVAWDKMEKDRLKETPWLTYQVYRDSIEIFMSGNKCRMRDHQVIYNRKYEITITKLDDARPERDTIAGILRP